MRDLQSTAREIFTQALAECSIARALDRVLRVEHDASLIIDGQPAIDLGRLKHVRIVAAGKAAGSMMEALLGRLGLPHACDFGGILIAPRRPADLPASVQFFAGGHPSPNAASFAGASAALTMLGEIASSPPEEALALFLISGGASAMVEMPADLSITQAETIAFHRALVHCSASIVEINCVRKHFSAVKGGRLALAAGSARKLTLAVSDVPSAHLDALASGPTLPDPTSVTDCRAVLARYGLLEHFPASVREFFESAALPETPKPDELISPVVTLLDSAALTEAALSSAEALGFHTIVDNACDDWHYERAGDYLLDRLRELRRGHPRCCVISTGEVSVPVPRLEGSDQRIGGRNQHLALYVATRLRTNDGPVAVLSAGSDGIDGNSDAAGAVVDERTIDERTIDERSAESARDSALRALAGFDSSTWLEARGATVVTGPTGQNLRDLRVLLAEGPQ